jgi:hypothetical protein
VSPATLGAQDVIAPVTVTLDYKKKPESTADTHWYDLLVSVKNTSRKRLDDWEVEFEFPTVLLDATVQAMHVPHRSNSETSFFLADGQKLGIRLRPDEERVIRIGYHVTHEIFHRHQHVLSDGSARARALVDGEIVAEIERPLNELQTF